jgi:hypothetical protein
MKRVNYFIVAYLNRPDGSRVPYLTMGGSTEDDARQKGFDLLGGQDFQIVALRASNEAEATSIWKRQRLEQTSDLQESVRRVQHKRRHF